MGTFFAGPTATNEWLKFIHSLRTDVILCNGALAIRAQEIIITEFYEQRNGLSNDDLFIPISEFVGGHLEIKLEDIVRIILGR